MAGASGKWHLREFVYRGMSETNIKSASLQRPITTKYEVLDSMEVTVAVADSFDDAMYACEKYAPAMVVKAGTGKVVYSVEAYCLECCGGGKSLGRFNKLVKAERAATAHGNAYGHRVSVIKSVNA